MARPIVALLTDFGTRDHYAGTMKGIVLGLCPEVTLVDITHDIPPHDVAAAAFELGACFRDFPPGTIFLVVVDPGVGSSRRGLAADVGDYRLVAPDNGVLSAVLAAAPPRKVVELTERKYARPTISRTFEGRDRFAPAAAWLARGLALTALGRPLADPVRLPLHVAEAVGRGIRGEIVRVDRFGNLVSNIERRRVEQLVAAHGAVTISVAGHDVPRLVQTYAEVEAGTLCALIGSSEHLEISVSGGSATERLAAGRGAPIDLQPV